MAELKRLRILVSAEDAVMVDIEPEQLQLLCSNLLLNALQHSPAGSAIRAVVGQNGELASSRMMATALPPRICPTSSIAFTAEIPRAAAIRAEPAWGWLFVKRSYPGGRERLRLRVS